MKTYVLRKQRLAPISGAGHATDAAVPDGGWKRLSNKQKGILSQLAAEAYRHQRVQGIPLDEWRHETAISACGLRISEANQDHYNDLKAAFLDLAGRVESALHTQFKAVDNKRRIALHKLTMACQERGLHLGYADKICKAQFKVGLEAASAKQLWCLFYTITNRRKKI